MTRIIEHRDETSRLGEVAEFRVYPSPKDASRVLGYVVPYVASKNSEWAQARTLIEYAEPVGEAFLSALALCEKHNVKILWVNDPEHLFPPSKRPVLDVS
ncbi:MAG: hypothetical protein ABSE69_20555 [Roseiarcus sp.]|jgi:hypothetical protein